ncbi:HET-E1 [Symbiodinium sp. CCMP2592]|nr:HET-E1 [Symbiodinium sp. CCMP2592]
MGDEEPQEEADSSLSWQDLPECVKKALDQESRQPSPEILSNLFSDDSDIKDFVESLGLTMGSAEWFSACEILEKVCADVSPAADRVVRTRAVQGQLAQTSSSISAGPQQQLEVSTGWLQTRAGAKRSLTAWPCRLAKKLALAKHDRARADAEAAELRRWRQALAKELKRAGMPVCSMASYALDSQAVLEASAGTLRASTLRRHVREWSKFSAWFFAVEGTVFPTHLGILMNYVEELAQEPCARTRLQSVLSAVIFFERVGGVKVEASISSHVLVRNLVRVRTAELEAGAPPTKQAPALALIMVMSLEAVVVNSAHKKFVRAYAWARLLKLWTSSRANDLQGILPEQMTMSSQGLRGVFDRTKTSGADKRIRWLPFFVCKDAWLLRSDWLAAGYEIWASDGFAFSRDYLVPRPTKGLTSCLPVMASYVDMSTMSKQLLWELKRPELTEAGSVRLTDVALFEDPSVVGLDDLFQALQRAGVESSVRDRALDLLRPLEGLLRSRIHASSLEKLRRLHRVGGCGSTPESVANCELFESLEGVSYDWQCKHCFKPEQGQQAAQANASGSEDFSSSTADEAQTSGTISFFITRLEGLMEPEPASEPSAELHERESTDDTFLLLSDHVWELEQRVAVLERRLIAVDPGKGKGKALKRALAAAAAEEAPGKKENVSQGLDSPPQSDISFLYLFAGESRRADLKSFLAAACEKAGLSFRYQEVDIGESAPDVLSDSFWLRLLNQVRRHEFNLLFMSPPYSTFNRATFVNRTGPPPLRNSDWPEGFPWLSGVWKSKAEAGTSLVRRVLSLATLATKEHVPWLIEHPEFLGATAAGTPASIWTWEEAVRVFQETRATSVALHLCAFGAAQRRPTRLAGTWHGLRSVGVSGWPRLDPQQHYRGPLSRKCGHAHAPLIGTDENGHFLAGPAAYPSGFCEALASIAVLTFRQRVSSESVLGEEQARSSDTLENATSTAVVHQAEALAGRLQHSAVSKESLLQIFDLLPGEELARDGVTWKDSKSFAVGAYAVGGSLAGLRRNSRLFPGVVRVLCRFVRGLDASITFSAIAIFRNLQTAPHRDTGNERGSRNLVAGLTSFRGGGIWTQDGGGQEPCPSNPSLGLGHTLELDDGCHACFDPTAWHCTQAWEGTRTVLVAYTPRVNPSFPSADWRFLEELGFNLPPQPGVASLPRAVKRILEDNNDDAVPKDDEWWRPKPDNQDDEEEGGSTSEEDVDGVPKAKLGEGLLGFGPPGQRIAEWKEKRVSKAAAKLKKAERLREKDPWK